MVCTADNPDWMSDGQDWPNRSASQFIEAGALRWHVQRMGNGPILLLLHGTGAATHSWRDLMPLLAEHFTVIAPDLPGHGFTERPRLKRDLSLPGMARALAALLDALGVDPDLTAGHSAGAALLIRMRLDGHIAPKALIGFNAALLPFNGLAAKVLPPMAKLLFSNPVAPRYFAWQAGGSTAVARLLRNTGSTIDPEGINYYTRLFRRSGHVAATLGMMANWDLETLARELRMLDVPLFLIAAANDRTISPMDAFKVKDSVRNCDVTYVKDFGHLIHEEHPGLATDLIVQRAKAVDVLPSA